MELLALEGKKFRLSLARREVVFMSSILNEVCNGYFLPQFQERIGVDEQAAQRLLAEIHALAESAPREEEGQTQATERGRRAAVVDLSKEQLGAVRNALHETLRELGVDEFEIRVGTRFEEGSAILAQLDEILRAMDDRA